MRHRLTSLFDKTATYTLLIGFAFFFFVPLVWLLVASVDPQASIALRMPDALSLEHFTNLFEEGDVVNWLKNSLIMSLSTMVATSLLATLAAYPLSRVEFPGKFILMYGLLLTRIMPIPSIIVPVFSISILLGLINTYLGAILVLTAIQLPVALWIMKGFVDTIPAEIEEAAWLDGCNRLTGLIRVVLPLTAPGIAVTGMFAFLGAWGDFLVPFILLRSPQMFPISIGLYTAFSQRGNVEFGRLAALAILYSLPAVIIYFLARQHLVKGMTAGSVKT